LPRELTLRLRAVLNRAYFPVVLMAAKKPIFRLGETEIDFNSAMVITPAVKLSLTAKEYTLLEKLYENRDRIFTGDRLCCAAGDRFCPGNAEPAECFAKRS